MLCDLVRPPIYVPASASGDLNSHQSGLISLTFDLLTSEVVRNISRGTDNLRANNLVLLRRFVVEVWVNTHQTDDGTFEISARVSDAGHRNSSVY